jgi:hypothetical protein
MLMSTHTKPQFLRALRLFLLVSMILAFLAGCNVPAATPFVLPSATPGLPTETPSPTLAPVLDTPTATLAPTDTSVPTLSNPVVVQTTLCFGGPGKVYGVISGIQAGTSLELLGKSALLDWWIVLNPTYNVPCWIAARDLQIDPGFDTAGLEVATPPPFPANLAPGRPALDPSPPTCSVQFTVSLNVTNKGSQATVSTGKVSAVDRRDSDGSQQATGSGTFPVLGPGETYRVSIPLTVSKWYNEKHVISLAVDPDKVIPEYDEGDNKTSISYTLQQGSCP